jgi:hypothetical protein
MYSNINIQFVLQYIECGLFWNCNKNSISDILYKRGVLLLELHLFLNGTETNIWHTQPYVSAKWVLEAVMPWHGMAQVTWWNLFVNLFYHIPPSPPPRTAMAKSAQT